MMESTTTETPRHVVAVVGAATAGAEIAHILAERGAQVVVLEQNPRPYGKIEDGLPRWHVKQRRDEYEEINRRLDHPNIEFVPLTRMGADITYDDLRQGWGLSAIVLAHGAWRDRPLAVEGADPQLIPDLSASADLQLGAPQSGVLVPLEALASSSGGTTVEVRNGTGWKEVPVTISSRTNTTAIVTSGLNPGDEIAIAHP